MIYDIPFLLFSHAQSLKLVVEALIDVPVASGDTPDRTRLPGSLVRATLHSAGGYYRVRRSWGFVALDSSTESDPCGDICKAHNYPVWNLGGCGEKYNT